jgi:hypothetical protein
MVCFACSKKLPSVVVSGSRAAAGGWAVAAAGVIGLGAESDATAATAGGRVFELDIVGVSVVFE